MWTVPSHTAAVLALNGLLELVAGYVGHIAVRTVSGSRAFSSPTAAKRNALY
jgi:hypothetical protein